MDFDINSNFFLCNRKIFSLKEKGVKNIMSFILSTGIYMDPVYTKLANQKPL